MLMTKPPIKTCTIFMAEILEKSQPRVYTVFGHVLYSYRSIILIPGSGYKAILYVILNSYIMQYVTHHVIVRLLD